VGNVRVAHVIGVRPNLMKFFPVYAALSNKGAEQFAFHTFQHYDNNMNNDFFKEFHCPDPTKVTNLPDDLKKCSPDVVLVYGDALPALEGARAANNLGIPVAHVEAGLRCFKEKLPEEDHRREIDKLAKYLFAPCEFSVKNLENENGKIFLVGNVMIDSLVQFVERAKEHTLSHFQIPETYVLLTSHRQANVDSKDRCALLIDMIRKLHPLHVVFPLHPRTKARMESFGLYEQLYELENCIILPPQQYTAFLALQMNARAVVTDSGGVQEETTYLGVPCITIRDDTERPITISVGTNEVVGFHPDAVQKQVEKVQNGQWKKGTIPPLWDGRAAERIAEILYKEFYA